MKPITLQTAAEVTGGILIGGNPDAVITGVVRDSREVRSGSLFLCIPGARVDGHDFAPKAFAAGAAACLAQRELPDAAGPVILVEDTLKALRALGKYYRSLLTIPVIGVIGSVGKTTAKEMTAAVLSAKYKVFRTPANLNNDIGVPLSLLSIGEDDEAAVIEMGISDFGEMSVLADMARPNLCIMTTIGYCHLENLHDLDGVLKAKSEVFQFMNSDSIAVVSGDDEKLAAFDPGIRKITFGLGSDCDWRAENVSTDGTDGVRCELVHEGHRFPVYIPAFGSHMVLGALPAAVIGSLLGETEEEITRGLLTYAPVGARASIEDTGYIRVINDCYNCNPNSAAASLRSLSTVSGRRVAILGDMKELGAASADLHRSTGRLAHEYGIDCLLCVGSEAVEIYNGYTEQPGGIARSYLDKQTLYADLAGLIQPGDTVLVKASHSMGFEEITEKLKALK